MSPSVLTQKLWNCRSVLHDDGIDYGDHVEQLSYLLVLKMADERKATWSAENPNGRWRAYDVDELMARDMASLDIFWLRDESDSDNLQPPEVIAHEIVDDLEAALEPFGLIAADLGAPAE